MNQPKPTKTNQPAELPTSGGGGAKCTHPPTRLYTWFARDINGEDVLCIACCDCGQILQGAATLAPLEPTTEGGGDE